MTPSTRLALGSARAPRLAQLVLWTCALLFVPLTLHAAPVSVQGQVRIDGAPAANLSIAANTGRSGHAARTDAKGRFAFTAPMDTGPARLVLQVDEMTVHHQDITVEEATDVMIDLMRGRLQGTVVDTRGGGPIADAEVTLTRVSGSAASSITSVHSHSAADGRFDLRPTAPGRYTLTVRRQGYGLDERAIALIDGNAVDGMTVTLAPLTDAQISVKAADGTPLRNLQAMVLDDQHRTVVASASADQVSVELKGVPTGTWRLLALAEGMAVRQIAWEVPGTVPPVVLEPEARLTINVPALANASDGATATVAIRDGERRSLLPPWASQHSETWLLLNGSRTIGHLPASPFTVEVTASDGRTWRREVDGQAGTTTTVVLE